MMRGVLLTVLLAATATAVAAPPPIDITPLTAAEVPTLLAPPAHGERIVMLWALDCVYCEPNMQALAKLQQAHPRAVQLVTVATDDIRGAKAAVAKRLAAAGMQGYPARSYAAAAPQQINFLIDPTWGGELPRTLVIRADGSKTAISGKLSPAQLRLIAPR